MEVGKWDNGSISIPKIKKFRKSDNLKTCNCPFEKLSDLEMSQYTHSLNIKEGDLKDI